MRLKVPPMCLLFRFAVLCMFVSTQAWGCGDSGISCPDGYKCNSRDEGESCPDGGQECCFDRSQDEESKVTIVFAIVIPICLLCLAIGACIYKRKYQCAENETKECNGFQFWEIKLLSISKTENAKTRKHDNPKTQNKNNHEVGAYEFSRPSKLNTLAHSISK